MPELPTNSDYLQTSRIVVTTTTYPAAATDVAGREAEIALWQKGREQAQTLDAEEDRQAALAALGPKPAPLALGDPITKKVTTGGRAIFWSRGVRPVDEQGNQLADVKPVPVGEPRQVDEHTTEVVMAYPPGTRLQGQGSFQLDFLLYGLLGMDLTTKSNATLETLELPTVIVAPFLVMVLLSLVTRPNEKQALDRLYVKMKTPVDPDPEADRRELEKSYTNPSRFDHRRLFRGGSLELQRPTAADAIGFLACFAICFLIIWLASAVAMIGHG